MRNPRNDVRVLSAPSTFTERSVMAFEPLLLICQVIRVCFGVLGHIDQLSQMQNRALIFSSQLSLLPLCLPLEKFLDFFGLVVFW